MLEEYARQSPVLLHILAKRGVIELHDIDLFPIHLPLNQPVDVGVLKFVNGMREDRAELRLALIRAHEELG